MTTRVQKWGNSLAVRIPKAIASEATIREDDEVDLTVESGRVMLSPVKRHPVYKLSDMLAEMTDDTLHDPIDFGPPVGEEIW